MYKHDNRHVTFASESEGLPTTLPNHHVTLPKEQLQSFRDSYDQLLNFIASIIGVDYKKMNTFDMLKFEYEYGELKKKMADYDKVILKYAGIAPQQHYSADKGYDPQSGFSNFSRSWETDDYQEAREVWLKYNTDKKVKP